MADPDRAARMLTACAEGRLAPNMTLFHVLVASDDEEEARETLRRFHASQAGDEAARERIAQVQSLWARVQDAFQRVSGLLALVPSMMNEGGWGKVFDEAAAVNPQAAVALYSLGDPVLLQKATEEVVARLRDWKLIGSARSILDFGCGTGRIAAAIAPLVRHVTAVDASAKMVELSRKTLAGIWNTDVIHADSLSRTQGPFDTVLAIDSMPYVVHGGTAARVWRDVARVLRSGGGLADHELLLSRRSGTRPG